MVSTQWQPPVYNALSVLNEMLDSQSSRRQIPNLKSMIVVLGELEQDHTGQNGFPADGEGGPDSSPPNVHLRSLRLESTAHNQFNRSGSSGCSLLKRAAQGCWHVTSA